MELYNSLSQKLNTTNFWASLTSSVRELKYGTQRISTPMLSSDLKKFDLGKIQSTLDTRGSYVPLSLLPKTEQAKQKSAAVSALDVAKEIPGQISKQIGQPSLRAYSALASGLSKLPGPLNAISSLISGDKKGVTLTPSTQYQKDLFGTDKPITFSSVGGEFPGAKGRDIAPVLGFLFGALDVVPGGGPAKKVLTPLEEAYKVFQPEVKQGTPIVNKAKDFIARLQTGLTSEFTPLRKAEEEIYKAAGIERPRLDLARKFEQVAGAPAKAEADIIRFKNLVVEPIKRNYEDFNALMFLRRTIDRLETDPTVRKVGSWTAEKAKVALQELKTKLGPDKFAQLDSISTAQYQLSMDAALRLQVAAGRMSEALYEGIKKSNDFYAPFKVLKHVEGVEGGTGRRIPTLEGLTKQITGIQDEDVKIGDILQRSAEIIYKSRILAEKNLKMLELAELGRFDKEGNFVRVLKEGEEAGKGFETVSFFKNGEPQRLAVRPDIADALSGGQATRGLLSKTLAATATPFRWGATSANLAFQVVNLLGADLPTLALVSKYGVRNPADLVRFPLDVAYAFFTSFTGNFGKPNKLFMEWLQSGAANSTIQRELTAESFVPSFVKLKPRTVGGKVVQVARNSTLDKIAQFNNAIEETAKIAGFKRGLRIENIEKLPPAEQKAKMAELVTEIRNYSGSPDFFRKGTLNTDKSLSLNLIFMFFNARIQGAAAVLGRLAGATGGKNAAMAWSRLATIVGIPAATLAIVNRSPEYINDYMAIPEEERRNYFMIPRDAFFFTEDGQRVRDYWRIPKREVVKLFSNLIEGAVEFGHTKDPGNFGNLAISFLEDISPISIQGQNFSERIESSVSSMNPLIKAPVELGLGRNTFYHQDTIPDRLKNVSPELQYRKNTPEFFKYVGEKTGMSPLQTEQATQSLTAGLFTQFTPPRNNEDRTILSQLPGLKRFTRSRTVNETVQQKRITDVLTKQADENVTLQREAEEIWARLSNMPASQANKEAKVIQKENPRLYAKLKDVVESEKLGLTYNDRLIKQLQVTNGERAKFIWSEVQMLSTPQEKNAYVEELREKKIISPAVMAQLRTLAASQQPVNEGQ